MKRTSAFTCILTIIYWTSSEAGPIVTESFTGTIDHADAGFGLSGLSSNGPNVTGTFIYDPATGNTESLSMNVGNGLLVWTAQSLVDNGILVKGHLKIGKFTFDEVVLRGTENPANVTLPPSATISPSDGLSFELSLEDVTAKNVVNGAPPPASFNLADWNPGNLANEVTVTVEQLSPVRYFFFTLDSLEVAPRSVPEPSSFVISSILLAGTGIARLARRKHGG